MRVSCGFLLLGLLLLSTPASFASSGDTDTSYYLIFGVISLIDAFLSETAKLSVNGSVPNSSPPTDFIDNFVSVIESSFSNATIRDIKHNWCLLNPVAFMINIAIQEMHLPTTATGNSDEPTTACEPTENYIRMLLKALSFESSSPRRDSNSLLTGCRWRGTAPLCVSHCETEERQLREAAMETEKEFGGPCVVGRKSFCCRGSLEGELSGVWVSGGSGAMFNCTTDGGEGCGQLTCKEEVEETFVLEGTSCNQLTRKNVTGLIGVGEIIWKNNNATLDDHWFKL